MEASGLKEALVELNRVAAQAAGAKLEKVVVTDGLGGTLEVPIAMLPGAVGGVVAQSMLDVVSNGAAFATKARLAIADGPDRREGTASLQSLESFIAHANRFKAAHSAVWADAEKRLLVSVLDYHPEGATSKAKWGRHRGTYACPLSEAWLAWGGVHGLTLGQESFAELLDSRDQELAAGKLPSGAEAPTPAALISLANNLEVYSMANAKRERDQNTGKVRISYSEEKGVSGTVMPPPAFLACIPIFQDGGAIPLEVRLRVTVEEAHAKFHVQIHRASDVLRTAFAGLCDRVEGETSLPVFVGRPE